MAANAHSSPSSVPRVAVVVIAVIVVIAAMRTAQAILVPVIVASFLAVIGLPTVRWLATKRVPNGIAIGIVVIGMMGILALIGTLLGGSLNAFSEQLPYYEQRIQEKLLTLTERFEWLGEYVGSDATPRELMGRIDPTLAMGLTARMLSGLSSTFANTFLILATMIFILLEASTFPGKVRAMLSDSRQTISRFQRFSSNLNRYLVIKSIISVLTGLIVMIWLALLGIDFAVMWGVLAFFLNFIPSIGSIIASVPPILLGMIQYGPGRATLVAAGFLVINIAIGSILEPRVMGRGLGMSALVVFLSLVFWGWVFGPVGMLFSVPLTMTIMIALESSEQTRPLAILLGSAATVEAVSEGPSPKDAAQGA